MNYFIKKTCSPWFSVLINIIFPINCIGCQKENIHICDDCLMDSKKATESPEDFINPVFSYRDLVIKKSIWKFKFEGKRGFVYPLSSMLYDNLLEFLSEEEVMYNFTKPILLSIPSSRQHSKKREYDQGELLCEALVQLDNNTSFDYHKKILTRQISSMPQTDIKNKSARIKNIRGAFSISENALKYVKNKNILLIDDVTTTGATLIEAKKVLKRAGAKRVVAFVLAH